MKRFISLILIILSLQSCGDQKIDTAKAKAEMEAREIKKVSEAEIVAEALRLGRILSADFKIENTLGDNQMPKAVITFGNDSIHDKAHYFLNQENDLSGKALGIFQAYQYNLKNEIESEDIVQKLEDQNTFLYTAPSLKEGKLVGVWAIKSKQPIGLN